MSWEVQGRQYHQWFGHGTGDGAEAADGPTDVAGAVGAAAVAALGVRGGALGRVLAEGGAEDLAAGLPIWVAASGLRAERFRAAVVGPGFGVAGAAALQAMARGLGQTRGAGVGQDDVTAAGRHLAAALGREDVEDWGYKLNYARDMAEYAAANETSQNVLRISGLEQHASQSTAQIKERAQDGEDGSSLQEKISGGSDVEPRSVTGPYSPEHGGYHNYPSGPNVVCPVELACTAGEIAEQLARFSLPGRSPDKPVKTKETYLVYDPKTGLPVGYVRTTVSSDGLTIQNVTRPLHILYDGQITRMARQNPDGSWAVTTFGVGNNRIPGMASENERVGPGIFGDLDMQMRRSIERRHSKH